jgi:Ala-tRNA(Pro) deacylase
VLLGDASGYLVAVVPASRRVELQSLERQLGRRLVLASESEVQDVFCDCTEGAIPAIGQAYGLEVVWDDCLAACPDVYFEAGDHTDLVRMSGKEFTFLMGRRPHGAISSPDLRH